MKDNFDLILRWILEAEGGFANSEYDSGGPTQYGLSLRLMKMLKMDLDNDGDVDINDVRLVNVDIVRAVFIKEFWSKIDGDNLPGGIDLQAADFAFTSGPGRAKSLLIYKNNDTFFAWRIRFYYAISRTGKNKANWGGWASRAVKCWLYSQQFVQLRG